MTLEPIRRVRYLFKPSNHAQVGYDEGYQDGLIAGEDFGTRIAYNRTLTKEIGGILGRYGRLQLKLLDTNATKSQMQKAYENFMQSEIDRFKMELQNR